MSKHCLVTFLKSRDSRWINAMSGQKIYTFFKNDTWMSMNSWATRMETASNKYIVFLQYIKAKGIYLHPIPTYNG